MDIIGRIDVSLCAVVKHAVVPRKYGDSLYSAIQVIAVLVKQLVHLCLVAVSFER